MKEIRELYGQAWTLGGSRRYAAGVGVALALGLVFSITPWIVGIPLFILYTLLHAGVQYRILTIQHEQVTMDMRITLMVRAARMWYFFLGFTVMTLVMEFHSVYFPQTS